MNQRERFLRTMRFQSPDRAPLWFPWLYASTVRRWRAEGLPADARLEQLFGCDTFLDVDLCCGFSPPLEQRVLAQDERFTVKTDVTGATVRVFRDDPDESMPFFVSRAVSDRKSYERLRDRLRLNAGSRFPADWATRCRLWEHRSVPLRFWGNGQSRREAGFFGPLRDLMGLKALLYALYNEPGFVERMMDDRAELLLEILAKVLDDAEVDFFVFWEDMACNTGPLISPEMFRKFLVPRYRKVTDLLRSRGVDVIIVDSDGDIRELIPLWLEAGVNGMLPFEVTAGMDVVALRRQYGRDLLMIGGVDKKELVKGPRSIDAEIERIRPVLSTGGYIPFPDHIVPHDTALGNLLHYLERLGRVLEEG
jgi:hypothetical protein